MMPEIPDVLGVIMNIHTLQIEKPHLLFLLIPLVVFVLVILMINFVRFGSEEKRKNRSYRFWMFISRTLLLALLVFALTNPYITKKEASDGNPEVTLLYDNSTSMELFDVDVERLRDQLEDELPVNFKFIATDLRSPLGDEIFRQLSKKNLLLVTDGNNDDESMGFSDVVSFAEKFNTTINAIKLTPKQKDVSIAVDGPSTSIVETDYNFQLSLNNLEGSVKVQVLIDNVVIFDESVTEETIKLKKRFDQVGQHTIVAKVLTDDYFEINNIYYKTIDVVEKPKVLYLSEKTSLLDKILTSRFEVVKTTQVPGSLDGYFAVVIDDMMHKIPENQARILETFTDDGNGLVVFGGQNSFKGPSHIDLLLPVVVGIPEEGEGVTFNFMILVDASGYVASKYTGEEEAAGQILTVLAKRPQPVQLSVANFAHVGMMIHPWGGKDQADAMIKAMISHKDVVEIDGIAWYRPAEIHEGLDLAIKEFNGRDGNNNVIVISDGSIRGQLFEQALPKFQVLRDMDVRVHSFNFVNPDVEDSALKPTRQEISAQGRGLFMEHTADVGKLFEKNLIISNPNHWITADAKVTGEVLAHNNVLPTASARSLVTTGTGVPILTTNSYNKVAVISTDNGAKWAPDLFNSKNIFLVYRTIDWAVGDPNRNKGEYLEVDDAIVNKNTKVRYKTSSKPITEQCRFIIIDDHYECTIIPQKIGFETILNKQYAVNYDEEYRKTGFNEQQLDLLVEKTKGNYFDAADIKNIIKQTKTNAKVEIIKKEHLDWYLLIFAILLFLFEVFIRRLRDKMKNS